VRTFGRLDVIFNNAAMAYFNWLEDISDESGTAIVGRKWEVKLYQVPNTHVSGMLVGYVPDARVLFTADLVSDAFSLIPVFASTVHELIQKKELSV
jgi:hypothetical protein